MRILLMFMKVPKTRDVQVATVTACRTTKDSVWLPPTLPDAEPWG